jgi:hypothetical protein
MRKTDFTTKIFALGVLLTLGGCMQAKALPHMDELLVLKAYSDEKEAQRSWVGAENQKFERLLITVKDKSIKSYADQDAVLTEFGPPVISDHVKENDQTLTRWLYRHPIQRFATDRVYLYFSPDGHMLKSELIPSQ